MSCFNSEATVGQAVESVLSQSYADFRFVIYDDASSDGTVGILKAYGDPRIDLHLMPQNRGLSINLHEGVAQATTPFIARIDADDIALPERLEEQLRFMQAHPEIDVLGSDVYFFGDDGREVLGRQPESHEDIAVALFFGFTMLHPTVMLRRSALLQGRWNYNRRFRYSQDFDLWTRMIGGHRFANLPKPLMRLRNHPGRISRAKRVRQQRFSTLIRARQILGVLPDAECDEIKLLAKAARGDALQGAKEVEQLEKVLLRVIKGNEIAGVYEAQSFKRAAAELFERHCRDLLHAGDLAGARCMHSPLNAFSPSRSLKSQFKLLALGALAISKSWQVR